MTFPMRIMIVILGLLGLFALMHVIKNDLYLNPMEPLVKHEAAQ